MNKLERVARAICRAKGLAEDHPPSQGLGPSGSGMAYTERPKQPWERFIPEATEHIAAFEVLMDERERR